jgi:hypothetical protein
MAIRRDGKLDARAAHSANQITIGHGDAMNHHDVEQELQHFEYVFAHLSVKHTIPPISYWRGRLDSLGKRPVVPSQRARINRLGELLGTLELAMNKATTDTTPAPRETMVQIAPRSRR